MRPPAAEQGVLVVDVLTLARAELIVGIDVVAVIFIAFEHHQLFVEENEVGAFIKLREHGESFRKFQCVATIGDVALRSGYAEFDETQDLGGQRGADSRDRTRGTAVDEAMIDLRINASHQDDGRIFAGDVFGCITERRRAAEFFEADKRGKFRA